jgi:hypothetical protein
MAWSWVSLTARFGQHGRVFAENGLSWAPDSLVDYAQAILASETTLKELVTVAAHGETPSGPTGAVNLVMRLAEALDVRADDVSAGKFRATRYRLKGEPARE